MKIIFVVSCFAMAPKTIPSPKRGSLRRLPRKQVNKDEETRQSRRSSKKVVLKPTYVPTHRVFDDKPTETRTLTWMNSKIVLEDFLKMSEKSFLQSLCHGIFGLHDKGAGKAGEEVVVMPGGRLAAAVKQNASCEAGLLAAGQHVQSHGHP